MSATFSSVPSLFIEMRDQACSTVEPTLSAPPSVFCSTPWTQDVVWWPWRCCCPSKLRFWTFVLSDAPANVSHTELQCNPSWSPWPLTQLMNSDTVACVTDQWRNVNARANCQYSSRRWAPCLWVFQSSLHPPSHGWRRPAFLPKGNSTHIAGVPRGNARFASTLSLRLWSVQLPLSWFPSCWKAMSEALLCHVLTGSSTGLELSMFLCIQLLRRIVALLSLRSRSSHRFAMIHRHCIQQTFHIPLIQLNMPTKFTNRDVTFEKMSFTMVFRFQTCNFRFTRIFLQNSSVNFSKLRVTPHTRKSSPCCSRSKSSQNLL